MTEPKGLLLLFLPFTVLTNNKLAEREESIVPQIRLSLTHFVNCPLAQPLQCQIKSQNLLHLPRVFNTPVRYDWFSDSPPMRLFAKAKTVPAFPPASVTSLLRGGIATTIALSSICSS